MIFGGPLAIGDHSGEDSPWIFSGKFTECPASASYRLLLVPLLNCAHA